MKKYLKKTFSVFMALLMVLSTLFVIVPEFALEAEAAAAPNTKYTMVVHHTNSNPCDGAVVGVWYCPNNGTGTEAYHEFQTNFTVRNATSTTIDLSAYGMPTAVKFYVETSRYSTTNITVDKVTLNGRTILDCNATFDWTRSGLIGDDWRSKTYRATWPGGTTGTHSNERGNPDESTIVWDWPKPALSLDWDDTTNAKCNLSATVPLSGTTTLETPTVSYHDTYYNTSWYQKPSYAISAEAGLNTVTDTAITGAAGMTFTPATNATTKTSVSITNAFKQYVYEHARDDVGEGYDNDYQVKLYITPYIGSTYASRTCEFTITQCKYTAAFKTDHYPVSLKKNTEDAAQTYNGPTVLTPELFYGEPIPFYFDEGEATGYTFDGMYSGDTLINSCVENKATTDYIAKWSPIDNKYAFYDYDGQLITEGTAKYDTSVSAVTPANPADFTNELATYTFSRWVNMDTGEAMGSENFSCPNSVDVLRYKAEYVIKADTATQYTTTFKNYDGATLSSFTGIFNSWVTFPTVTPSRPGDLDSNGNAINSYRFIGWSTEQDGEVMLEPGETFRTDGNRTFYAVFEEQPVTYTITTSYGTNSGANTGSGTYTAEYGEYVEIPTPADWRDSSYTNKFSYWTLDGGDGTQLTPSLGKLRVQVLGDASYTAHYTQTAIEYHAWFYNGTEKFDDQILSNGDRVSLPAEIPTKEREGNTSYEFAGWFEYDAETDTWGNQFTEESVYTINGNDLAFYARYNEIKHSTVKFYTYDGVLIEQESYDYVVGAEVVIPQAPAREETVQYSYEFTGWTTPEGIFKADGAVITAGAKDNVYIATYRQTVRKYPVKFYAEDGETLISELEYAYGTTPVAPEAPGKPSTDRYSYSFNGWYNGTVSFSAGNIPAVTGEATYTATYKATDIIYSVHWLTFKNYENNDFDDNTVGYLYNRIISMPVTVPVCDNTGDPNNPGAGYTWGFTGWFRSDAQGNLQYDEEGNPIPYVKGTNIRSEMYYVSVFEYIPDAHKVNVYADAAGTELLGTYVGGYNQTIEIENFGKDPIANGHYVVDSFTDMQTGVAYDAKETEETTTFLVTADVNLYISWTLAGHGYDADEDGEDDWVIDIEPSYKDFGLQHKICSVCRYRFEEQIAKLIDATAPSAQITIAGNNWVRAGNTDEIAYVRADSIVSILTTDIGNGIKEIVYTWKDGEAVTYTVAEEFDTAENFNFPIPADFPDKYLEVCVRDYKDHEIYLDTATLKLDSVSPEIGVYNGCTFFIISVLDDHEINEVKITGPAGSTINRKPEDVIGENGEIYYILGDETGNTANMPTGTYTVTVTDKAGNISEEKVRITNEHVASDWITDMEPTCTEAGSKHKECKACDRVLETAAIEALGHDFTGEYVIDVEPTCTEPGEKSHHCLREGCTAQDMTIVIDALGHKYEDVVTEPTCTEPGYTTHTCSVCDNTYTDSDTAALGCDWDEGVVTPATCTEGGFTTYTCKRCGAIKIDDYTSVIPHDYEEKVSISECSGEEVVEHICKVCGDYQLVSGSYDSHTWVEEAFPATCTGDAYVVETCEKCKISYTSVDRLSRLGHAWAEDYTIDKEATCTEAGSKSIHCTVCEATKRITAIPATGHSLVLNEEKSYDATCALGGYELWECSVCDYFEEKTFEATGKHTHVKNEEKSTASTCTVAGYDFMECNCGDSYTVELPLAEHTQGEVVSTVAGTCQVKSSTTYACAVCEGEFTVEGEYGAHVASDTLVRTIVAATCTAEGEGVYKCESCEATVLGVIAAQGHNYKAVVTAPDCTNGGFTTHTCTRCGISYVDTEVDPVGHIWNTEYTVDLEPTCENNGSKSIHCSVCDTIDPSTVEIIEATGNHTSSEWIVDKKATCTENGSQHKECTVCGEELEREVLPSKDGHTKGALVRTEVPATCCLDGRGVYKCTVCGETYYDVIPADGVSHSYSAWVVTTEADCETDGIKTKTCTNKNADGVVCGHAVTKTDPAPGHSFKKTGEEIVLEGNNFVTRYTYTCTRCNGTTTESFATSAYLVTIINLATNETSTLIYEEGAKLSKYDLPEIEIPEDNGENTYKLSWIYADGSEVKFPVEITADTTIYAKITSEIKTYTITFVNRLGKVISQAEYELGAEVAVPDDQLVAGYTFNGWSDGITVYDPSNIPAVSGDATYMADYTANEGTVAYYVTYKNDTGIKTLYTQVVDENATATAPETNPTKTANTVYHYVFIGWVDENGAAYNFATAVTKNITLYAKFDAVKHSDDYTSVVSPATCSKAAESVNTCKGCGYEWVTYTDPATGHTYKEISRVTTADGQVQVTYQCSTCGDQWIKTITQGLADTNAIIVTVTDTSGNAVAGASVVIYTGDLQVTSAVTNEKGKAYFAKEVVADGSYRVKVTKSGYDDLSGTLVVKDGKGSVKLSSFSITECHCVCHSSGFFGKIRRWFTNLLRKLIKDYQCCDCGHMNTIY